MLLRPTLPITRVPMLPKTLGASGQLHTRHPKERPAQEMQIQNTWTMSPREKTFIKEADGTDEGVGKEKTPLTASGA